MAMSMEDILEKGFVAEKEPLIVHSRSKLKAVCKALGITNERRVASEYSALVNMHNRIEKLSASNHVGDKEDAERLQGFLERLIESWKEDEAVTEI